MTHLAESPILKDIEAAVASITDSHLKRAESKMDKLTDKDRSLGVVTNPLTKRLFMAARMFAVASKKYAVQSVGAESDEDEKEYKRLAARFDQIEDVCRELVWTQIREELNLFEPVTNIGIREAWMVIELDKSSPEFLIQGLDGLKHLMGHLRQINEESDD